MATPVAQDALAREVQALREMVSALTAGLEMQRHVTIRPLVAQPFLGQPATLIATITDGRGAPVPYAPVTLVATWGHLRLTDERGVQQGSSIAARAGIDGTARVTLLPPTSEDLLHNQQAALQTMLVRLDASAATPREDAKGFQDLVRQYRWEANALFRAAVDIYFRDFRANLKDTINVRDYMASWEYFDATVIAHARDESAEADSRVRGTGALTLRFKDWIAPFLETYLALERGDASLSNDLYGARVRNKAAVNLQNAIYRRVRDYMDIQQGRVGEYVGRQVSATILQDFADTQLAALPVEARAALIPAVKQASSTIVAAGPAVLNAIGQTRVELQREISDSVKGFDLGDLGGRLAGVEEALGAKLDRSALDAALDSRLNQAMTGFETTLNERLAGFEAAFTQQLDGKLDTTALQDFESRLTAGVDRQLAERMSGFETTFDARLTDLEGQIGGKLDAGALEEAEARLNAQIDASIQGSLRNVEGVVKEQVAAQLDARLPALQREFSAQLARKVDVAEFQQFQTSVDERFNTKADATEFSRLEADFEAALQNKLDTTTFNQFSGTLNTQLDNLRIKTDQQATDISGLRTSVTDINRSIRRGPNL